MKIIGWIIIAIGVLIVVSRRIYGIDLTEGQLLMQDLPYWITALGCVVSGCAIIKNASE